MIIECTNCNKKFNVNSDLIPQEGRKIQCGSCNYNWYYKIDKRPSEKPILSSDEEFQTLNVDDNDKIINSNILSDNKELTLSEKKIDNKDNIKRDIESKSLSNFFSYILVFIISFIALLILIDTLKTTLINIFPKLEIILFNLFEILEDVKLFIIDLI